MSEQDDILRYQPPRHLKLYAAAIAGLFLLVLAEGLLSHLAAAQRLAAAARSSDIQTVSLVTPTAAAQAQTLTLPGTLKAYYQAPIYAQVSGYLQSWSTDIGTPVKAGQVLATIATPNLDQQLAQAQASLAAAEANEQIAATTAKRWDVMRAGGAMAPQDADQKDADYEAARAATAAARAVLAGLQAQEGFKRIVAPFDGVVTARNTDIGALITTGAAQTPLFIVDDESRLRLYVSVPESYAAQVRHCTGASFTVPDYPGRTFQATLAATAGAIDSASGTLLVQFQASNKDGALQPGDYAQAGITLPAGHGALSIPASALMFRDNGMQVATIGPDHRVTVKTVTIGRDLGNIVQIASGLSPTDQIINNPPDSLAPGDQVAIAPPGAT